MGREAEIVIVEDDMIVARMQKFNLEKLVSRPPVICANGQKAIEHLNTHHDFSQPCLIVLDLNMPVMNGWDFLEACQNQAFSNQIYVVVVTSSIFKADKDKARQFPHVIGYYTKPINKENFKEILSLPEVKEFFEPYLKVSD